MRTTAEYAAWLAEQEPWLSAVPLEHVARNRSFKDLLARLVSERNSLDAVTEPERAPRFVLVAAPEHVAAARDLWRLQAAPRLAVIQVLSAGDGDGTAPAHDSSEGRTDVEVAHAPAGKSLPDWIRDDDYLIPFAAGDWPHPALALTIAIRCASEGHADVWTWNVCGYRVENDRMLPVCFVRKPHAPDATWLSIDVGGRSCAIRAGAVRALGSGAEACLPSQVAATLRRLIVRAASWKHHPDYLALHPAQTADDLLSPSSLRKDVDGGVDDSQFASVLLPGANVERVARANASAPAARPRDTGNGISVVIPFRDKAELTLAAIASVAGQRTGSWVELVLVNNLSSPEQLERVRTGLETLDGGGRTIRTRLIDYPHPFNHSRQCNLGAREAAGDTLVFLNNDATLGSDDALETLARWAQVPGVGTVGPLIYKAGTELQCAGLRARRHPGADFNSLFEESRDPLAIQGLRRVAGNSFACAAVARSRFRDLGGLDEVLFPIGYNDIDFCLRATQRGWVHLLTGWISVSHVPGSSRGSSDEVLQKLALRERHGDAWLRSLSQLESDEALLKLAVGKGTATRDGSVLERLRRFWK